MAEIYEQTNNILTKLHCISIPCAISSRFENSYFSDIKFSYSKRPDYFNKSILIYPIINNHLKFKNNKLFPLDFLLS